MTWGRGAGCPTGYDVGVSVLRYVDHGQGGLSGVGVLLRDSHTLVLLDEVEVGVSLQHRHPGLEPTQWHRGVALQACRERSHDRHVTVMRPVVPLCLTRPRVSGSELIQWVHQLGLFEAHTK